MIQLSNGSEHSCQLINAFFFSLARHYSMVIKLKCWVYRHQAQIHALSPVSIVTLGKFANLSWSLLCKVGVVKV